MNAPSNKPLDIQKVICPRCGGLIDVTDYYCRYCGVATSNSCPSAAGSFSPNSQNPWGGIVRTIDRPWTVLVMLFLVAGPFAIPLLWRSRCFSFNAKIVLTVLVLLLTALVIAMGWYVFAKLLDPFAQLQMQLE